MYHWIWKEFEIIINLKLIEELVLIFLKTLSCIEKFKNGKNKNFKKIV